MSHFSRPSGVNCRNRPASTLVRRILHALSDTIGYGNLSGFLDLVIVQSLTFLVMSGIRFFVLLFAGVPFDEENKRTACLYIPAIAAPIPGVLLNNLHRFKMAMDRLLLTGDLMANDARLSVPQAYRLAGLLMAQIKEAVGYNQRPAWRYMKSAYPVLLSRVIERIRTSMAHPAPGTCGNGTAVI